MQGNDEPQRVFRSRALKRQIVEETLRAGASVSRVARKYGVNANQVFCWRRLYQQGELELRPKDLASIANPVNGHAADVAPALLPVQVVDALAVQSGAVAQIALIDSCRTDIGDLHGDHLEVLHVVAGWRLMALCTIP